MPAKKKKSVVKDALPDPATVKDGQHNYYIGGWSFYQSIEQINAITAALVAAHTNAEREVSAIPRTNVLVLPSTCSAAEAERQEDAQRDDVMELEVADQMQIEGVARATVAKSAALAKEWKRPEPPAAAEDAVAAAEGEAQRLVAEEVEEAAPAAADADGESEEPRQTAEEDAGKDPKEDEDNDPAELAALPVAFGADFAVRDAKLHGDITIVGVRPQIVVKPQLPKPLQPVEEEKPATKKGASKRKSKVKLTEEQLEELERKRAAEEARLAEETEAAVQAAQQQEDYLMTFAHPSRWAKVAITNMTFTGPVNVRQAHVTFTNCRFLYAGTDRPQLRVAQYCNVQCVKCTFEAISGTGAYALPASSSSFKRCLFTSALQEALLPLDAAAGAAAGGAGDREDEEGEEGGAAASRRGQSGDLPASPEVKKLFAATQSSRAASVGVYEHSCSVTVDASRFVLVGTAVLLHGKHAQEPVKLPARGAAKTSAHSVVRDSHFHFLFNSAIVVDSTARDVLIQRNEISDCAYYGVDCKTGCAHVYMYQNNFSIGGRVRIRQGVQAQMLHNKLQEIPVDDNTYDNPCLDPSY